MIKQTVFSVIVGVVALVLVFEMLRRRRLREKYAVLWLVIGVVALVVAAWPALLSNLAAAFGINTPSNLLFFASLGISFFVALQLSSEVGSLEEETRTLAEEVGMLRLQVAELAESIDKPATDAGVPSPVADQVEKIEPADQVESIEPVNSDQPPNDAPPQSHQGVENSGSGR